MRATTRDKGSERNAISAIKNFVDMGDFGYRSNSLLPNFKIKLTASGLSTKKFIFINENGFSSECVTAVPSVAAFTLLTYCYASFFILSQNTYLSIANSKGFLVIYSYV